MGKILITGASGHLGKAVTEFLLQKTDAGRIRVLVRDAAKAEVFGSKGVEIAVGDYNDHASLLAAFKDVDKLYLVSGTDIENRAAQQEGVIRAAKEAGVKHIVYTSYQRKTESANSPVAVIADSHLHTEKVLKESGLIYTILQDGLYAEVIPNFVGHNLMETKTIFFPSGEGKTAFAVRKDMAEASAVILLDETGKFDNRAVEMAGSEAVTWKEIAENISKITGETISYAPMSEAAFTEILTKAGVPAIYIGMQAGFGKAIEAGEFEGVNGELEEILGRKPVTVEAYLREVYGKEVLNPTQLSFVSLQVSDLEASGKFYTEILNFKPISKSPPDAIVFEPKNGASFAIRKPMIELSKANLLGWGVALWFAIGDLDAFLGRNANKIAIVKDIHPTPFGRILVISDPDGYSITLQETSKLN